MKSTLQSRLESVGQAHVLQFWDQLNPDQQKSLAAQIDAIDFELIQSLIDHPTSQTQWSELAARAEVPPAITHDDFADPESYAAARSAGELALSAGELGMVLVAGGQGSRLGFDHPKGMYPIGPLSQATLYQIHFEKVLARSQQFGAPIPIYVMTSPPTHEETTQFLQQHDYFGIDPEQVRIFCQGVMPAVDHQGKLLLSRPDQIFVSPNGHGGMLAGMVDHGCLEHAEQMGVKHLFYGQVDNPLIQICDPALVGYHLRAGSEMTSQVVRKNDPLQKVGNVVQVDGEVRIIEYSDLPESAARQTDANGQLKLWAGSIAVHIFDVNFLNSCSQRAETLPFHRAHKKVPFVDGQGEQVEPDEPNAIKFERFIFDLLPFADNAIVCEVDPADGFCALKNAPPAESETEAHVRAAISNLHRKWLREAGVQVADDVTVEISPLFAVDETIVAEKMKSSHPILEDTYLGPPT